jgi:hypothetical protein
MTSLRRRRGLASLELVLSMPFLVALAAIIHQLALKHQAEFASLTDARNQAWAVRDSLGTTETPDPANPAIPVDTIFQGVKATPEAFHVANSKTRTLNTYGIFRVQRQTMQGRLAVVGRSWDYHDIAFVDNGQMQPSNRLSGMMTGIPVAAVNAGSAITSSSIMGLFNGLQGGASSLSQSFNQSTANSGASQASGASGGLGSALDAGNGLLDQIKNLSPEKLLNLPKNLKAIWDAKDQIGSALSKITNVMNSDPMTDLLQKLAHDSEANDGSQ